MERTQFTFYESFYKALSRIRKDADRAKAYDAITRFALYGEEPELDDLPDNVAIAFELVRPNLEASRRKAEAGRKGGESKPEANASKSKQTGSKRKQTQANGKQEKEQEQEREQDRDKEQMLSARARAFAPPTVAEVDAYVRAKGYRVDAEAFVAFYASKGWKVGSAPMKDWKAAVVTWSKRERRDTGNPFLEIADEEARRFGQT